MCWVWVICSVVLMKLLHYDTSSTWHWSDSQLRQTSFMLWIPSLTSFVAGWRCGTLARPRRRLYCAASTRRILSVNTGRLSFTSRLCALVSNFVSLHTLAVWYNGDIIQVTLTTASYLYFCVLHRPFHCWKWLIRRVTFGADFIYIYFETT